MELEINKGTNGWGDCDGSFHVSVRSYVKVMKSGSGPHFTFQQVLIFRRLDKV